MEWLIDQKTQNSKLKRKEMHMRSRSKANWVGTSCVGILLNERKKEE